ncbi:MAG: ABC transporter ATP-binding protein/permease [Synergistaceae bacterium]|jgi:ATP-binding cassette subfamily B protein|nr:ABC transporter ATP-binding protein/permease [Synergistaceae bacterium]
MQFHEDEFSDRPFRLGVWAAMLPFFRPYRRTVAAALSLMLACSVIDVCIPLYQKYFIDAFIIPKVSRGIPAAALAGAAVILLEFLFVAIFTRMAIRVELGFSRDLKKACFDHLQTLSLSYYNTTPVGYILARVLSDTDKIGMLVAWGLVDLMWGLSYVVFAVVSMLLLDLRLGLWFTGLLPVLALITFWFQNKILRHNRKVRRANSFITGAFNEGILGARTSKTLVVEDLNAVEFSGLSGEMYRETIRAATLSAIYMPVMMAFGSFAVAMMLAQGSSYILKGSMAFGTLSALISYAINILEPIQHLSRFFSDATATGANIERVDALLKRKPEITDSPEVTEKYGDSFHPRRENWEPLFGDIRFDDVTFQYPDGDEEVLSHFSLDIPAGTCLAIVGETGAGKSTLVNLACRFFEPTSGRILIDGRDYRERSQLWLHSNIGCVLQTPHLFSGTIRDNVRYGRLDATDEQILEAIHLASADAVLRKLPQGLDSDVGEGGDRLSTGEKQLVAFARALLADPRIFVLDEATSSIDTETERLIQNAISKVLQGRTSFLIAHRLSTIRAADLILVVRDGKIIERGTHRELLRKRGYYLKLWSMQYEEDITDAWASKETRGNV